MDSELRSYLENHRAFLMTRRTRIKETLKEIETDIGRVDELLEINSLLIEAEEENVRVRAENEQLQAEVVHLRRSYDG